MIAGMMAIDGRFPLWENCLESLLGLSDKVVIRLDGNSIPDPECFERLLRRGYGDKIDAVMISDEEWNRWNWREDLLRMLDDLKPDIVLHPDQDEQFQPDVWDDIVRLRESQALALMFSYHAPLPTADGSDPCEGMPYPAYPGEPHMKAFKWLSTLTYKDYRGWAQVTNYADQGVLKLAAQSKILHYCCWTPEMRAAKDWKW